MREELVIDWQLASAAISKGKPIKRVLATLQDHWGLPIVSPSLRKADDDEPTVPGDHGIPEIGRQEKAFYDALTEGQRDAYKAITDMVNALYDENLGWAGVDPWAIDEPIDEWKRKAFLNLAANPLQAYMVGQMLTSEALASPIARPLMPTDRRAIEFLEHYTFNEIDDAFNGLKSTLRNQLIQGMEQGDNPKEVARRIGNELKDYDTDWSTITITETARADSAGRLNELLDAGFAQAIGSSAHDTRVCDKCLELIDGQIIDIAETIGKTNYGRKKDAWISVIPLHPRCRCVWLPYTKDVARIIQGAREA